MSLPTLLVLGLVAISVAGYVTMVASFLWGMRRPVRGALPQGVRVSVLKPLAGLDDELEENLASFLHLTGVDYEVLLGLSSPRDPAWPLAQALARAHPDRVRVVRTRRDAALNPKVAQLVGLEAAATGEVVVVSDSNVRVCPDYLENLLRLLWRPGVGLVSNVFRGTGEKTLGAALENLMLSCHTTPGVVSAVTVSGRAITMGKSMAMRRTDLARVGGFAGVGGYLAEDQALSRRFHAAGLGVVVSPDLIENRNVSASLRKTFDRHSRWAKIRRANAPAGLAVEPLLAPFAVATLGALVVPQALGWSLVAGTAILQLVGTQILVWRLRGRTWPWHLLPLELVRSFVFLAAVARGWGSRRVDWRGRPLVVGPDTRLLPARPRLWRRAVGVLGFREPA